MPDQHSSYTPQTASLSLWQKHQFWLFLVAAIILRQIPFVSIPFNWLESYFHEIGHGLAAIATGGKIVSIQLFTNGAGLCTTQGGYTFVISFFGYAGAIIWGALIYIFAGQHQRMAQLFSALIAALLAVSILLWARDLLTIIILAILLVIFIVTIRVKKLKTLQKFMQLFGLVVLLNSLFSPLYLLDGRNLGDGASLANQTGIPEILWVVIWTGLALVTIIYLSRIKVKA